MNGLNSNKLKEEIKNENKQMVKNGVWEPLDKNIYCKGEGHNINMGM